MIGYFLFLISVLTVFITKLIPLSFIIGSQKAFFSATTSLSLLVAAHSNLWMLLFFLIPLKDLSIAQLGLFLLNRIPLFFAAWSYRMPTAITSMVVPLNCFLLFILHPMGAQAWPYALYWFIPVVIYTLGYHTIFLKALSSVFVAHALGSVIWLYTHDMSPEIWLALIPIVAIERLLMALGVLLGEQIIASSKDLVSKMKLFCNGKIA